MRTFALRCAGKLEEFGCAKNLELSRPPRRELERGSVCTWLHKAGEMTKYKFESKWRAN